MSISEFIDGCNENLSIEDWGGNGVLPHPMYYRKAIVNGELETVIHCMDSGYTVYKADLSFFEDNVTHEINDNITWYIWNPAKVDGAQTIDEMLRGRTNNYSVFHGSEDAVKELLRITYNETDIHLKYGLTDTLLSHALACQYYLEMTDNEDCVAMVKYLNSLK